jgi:hypothetical protein
MFHGYQKLRTQITTFIAASYFMKTGLEDFEITETGSF